MKRFLALLICTTALLSGQEFSEYRLRYDQFAENDPRAVPHVQHYIAEAKKARNNRELFQAYKDAVHFIPDHKLAYADSAVWAATKTGDRGLIATAYITKGTVYYFNYRKFQPALDEYLKAWQFSRDSPDSYLHYKNLYHIGVVKSYLGYDEEALEIFEKCRTYFSQPQELPEPANRRHNRKKGYLNALHQMATSLMKVSRTGEAEAIIDEGLRESGAQGDFYLERSFFLKLKGIMAYRKRQDKAAIAALGTALLGFKKKNDFTSASLIYYYTGKSQLQAGLDREAVQNFAKVDSVFTEYAFVLPEVRGGYEFLIDYYQKKNDREREHYYTVQLLKADRVLNSDFKYLSGKIHREYDTEALLASKKRLERSVSTLYTVIWSITVILVTLGTVILYPKSRRKWLTEAVRKKKRQAGGSEPADGSGKDAQDRSPKVPAAIAGAVIEKLQVLEHNRFFLEQGMTLQKLAPLLNTNSYYLGLIIKEYRGCPYPAYIKELRLRYAAKMLGESKQWRSMTIENLANASGFKDRTHFSEAFFEYHKVKPLEFIQQIRAKQQEEP